MTLLITLPYFLVLREGFGAFGYPGERIVYTISPLGIAEFNNLGVVDLQGERVNLVTLKTQIFGFKDTERIYIDLSTLLPIRVERDVSGWVGKEYLTEEYDNKNFTLTVEKFKGNKKVGKYVFKKDSPIHNAVILPFYLRTVSDPEIGWSFTANIPDKYEIKLVAIEEIKIPAGTFQAYHFTSMPNRFEIWISKDEFRIPLKLQGMGGFGYTFIIKEHTLQQRQGK